MAIFAAALLASCGTSGKLASISALSGEWMITEVGGAAVTTPEGQNAPFIGFDTDKKQVYGSTSCNRLTGALNADAKTGKIDFGALGSTRMMCRDMETERKVLDAMGKAASYKVSKGGRLELRDEAGKAVMVLKHK